MAEHNQPASSLNINDILFVLFRHKWKIIFFTLLGIAGAAAAYYLKPPLFASESRLLIRYVKDVKTLDPLKDNEIVRGPANVGVPVNDEVEILTSQDALQKTVQRVGANKILAAYGGGTNEVAAMRLLSKNLHVEVAKNSGVMEIKLEHKDPEIAQTALRQLVQEYLELHVGVHSSEGGINVLEAQTTEVRRRLKTAEEELRREKMKVGVIDLAQSKKDLVVIMGSLKAEINGAEAELAERNAQIAQFEKLFPSADSSTSSNGPAAADLTRYKTLAEKLAKLKETESDLLIQYAEGSKAVKQIRTQIERTEEALKNLGVDPEAAMAAAKAASPKGTSFDIEAAKSRIVALQAKMEVLNKQLEEATAQAQKLDNAEASIMTIERQKTLADDLYQYFSKHLEQAKIDQQVDTGKVNNISIVQGASVAMQDFKKLYKLMGGIFAGFVGAGLALAFALDMVIDQSFKRPKEVENVLRVPLFAAIPHFGINGHSKLKRKPKRIKGSKELEKFDTMPNGEIAPWEESDPMLPYYEGLRDRLVMSYAGDLHKPKIVGLTSCNKSAGVTRIATGLAASLSRDAERNVLLIGLERDKVAVSAFSKGRPAALNHTPENENEEVPAELVEHNLYSLARREKNTGVSIVQTFCDMIPKLRASEYDYILFDLPPLTQTSGSLRLASQMERTLIVLEAEETSRESVKTAANLLTKARANVFAVLNKTRTYGPVKINEGI